MGKMIFVASTLGSKVARFQTKYSNLVKFLRALVEWKMLVHFMDKRLEYITAFDIFLGYFEIKW
jgi:hypothetical protein